MKFKIRARELLFFSFLLLLLAVSPPTVQCSSEEEEEIQRSQFPDAFFFGTSTSAYQVEGAYLEDGKSLANWDAFTHIPGNIINNDNGDVVDDHYHRYMEDIELLHSLGVNAYRFSISWARILPRGKSGDVNPEGIRFYNKIIDSLLLRGIEPFVTICHFDLPQSLEDKYGGWLNPLIREDFVYFAAICFKEFGDRVKYWVTINEPNHWVDFSYIRGMYPPGHCSLPFGNCSVGNSDAEPLVAMHNMLISHAMAADFYRKHFQAKQNGFVGMVVSSFMYEPLRDKEEDRQAVSRALAFTIAWALDPVVHGDYPEEMRECIGLKLPKFSAQEREILRRGSIDFIGINHYSTLYIKDCINSTCSPKSYHPIQGFVETTGLRDGLPIGQPTGKAVFFVVPRGMEEIIEYIKHRYNNILMFVTENGYASPLQENEQELLQDLNRIKFHKDYLIALARAVRKGANVRGYFIWSLMDNFEWADGYGTRFGLYYVDRTTLRRFPKLSAKWFTSFLTDTNASGHSHHEGVFLESI
ncbi:beta-glucosidase 18-like [Humulus lupulus]|uniref:beta-glucosidase 18-like n=1 Tax=Humulus lupulus TaxID=3486 RepID=UPI002B41759A|nr:beta-glucosidase 18-like [Humulus lupulus]